MHIPATNKTNKSRKFVYVIKKVKQLYFNQRVSKIVLSVGWRVDQTEKI